MSRLKTINKQLQNLVHLSVRDTSEDWKFHHGVPVSSRGCKPTNVNIEIINRCCLRCKMCDIWKNNSKNELTVSEWIIVLKQLKNWLGTFRLTITGGEPLMKPGIWDLLSYCGELGLPTVLVTSGYHLTLKNIDRLLNTNITQLVLSLDSLNALQHDSIRGVPGLFDRLWHSITTLSNQKKNFVIATNTVIMSDNIAQIPDFPATLSAVGVERIFFQPIQGGFKTSTFALDESDIWPKDREVINRTFESLKRTKLQFRSRMANTMEELNYFHSYFLEGQTWNRPFACSAGRKMFHCDAYGNVRMCIPYPGNIGNLRSETPESIWSGIQANSERPKIDACREACLLNCNRNYTNSEKVDYALTYFSNQFDNLF